MVTVLPQSAVPGANHRSIHYTRLGEESRCGRRRGLRRNRCWVDRLRRGTTHVAGTEVPGRAVGHLIEMQSAGIAAVITFLVVNFDAGLVVWLGPTVVITPIISWWRYRVSSGA